MNKNALLTLAFGAVLIFAASCSRNEETDTPVRRKIELKSLSGTTFQKGTKIGLFVENPSYENVALIVGDNGELTSSAELYWKAGQTEKSQVVAYVPYLSGVSSSSDIVFTVQADQTTTTALDASDLLVASCDADPAAESISLSFEHRMSEALIYFNNKTGEDISKVVIGGICITQNFRIWSGPGAVSAQGTVKAYADDGFYKLYFPAQTAGLTIEVTLAGGDVFEFELESNTFVAGKAYSNSESPIELSKSTPKQIKVNFSISDWVDGGQLKIKGEEPTPGKGETAILTYSEAKRQYSYNTPVSYSNSYGTWEICCYSNNNVTTAFQLNVCNKQRLAYLGTPEFSGRIDTVKIKATSPYSADVYICSAGDKESSSILKTAAGAGAETIIYTGDLDLSKLYIRSSAQFNISQLTIITGASEPVEETAFTRTTAPGFYINTSSNPQSTLLIEEQEQYSFVKSSSARNLTVADFSTGSYKVFTINTSSLTTGSKYSAVLIENGSTETGYDDLTCVKKTATQLWLEDKNQNIGFIIPIE